jgi:hypothetical protein
MAELDVGIQLLMDALLLKMIAVIHDHHLHQCFHLNLNL